MLRLEHGRSRITSQLPDLEHRASVIASSLFVFYDHTSLLPRFARRLVACHLTGYIMFLSLQVAIMGK